MAELPDPRAHLDAEGQAAFDRMAGVRSHADGPALGQVYVRMFNNPGVAEAVGALGEHLRFHGVLPDALREAVILHYAVRQRFGFVWAHHQGPARQAGLSEDDIAAITAGDVPGSLPDATLAALEVVDAVVEHRSVPADVQARLVDAHGTAGAVEVVAVCGLYALMGYTKIAYDVAVEPGLPTPPTPPF